MHSFRPLTVALAVALSILLAPIAASTASSVLGRDAAAGRVVKLKAKKGATRGPKGARGWRGPKGDRGGRGARGETGPSGPTGPAGPAGRDGAGVVARARSAGSVVSSTTPQPAANVSLTANSWTQAPAEVDGLIGQLTVTEPSAAACQISGSTGGLTVNVAVNGTQVATVSDLASGMSNKTIPLAQAWLMEPGGGGATNTLSVTITDTCISGGGHFTVGAVAIDALGAH